VKVLGWSSDPIAGNESVVGISHPLGDFKRIAFGRRTRDLTIRFSDGQRMPASVGYQVAWLQGVTQSGSSGSPLLATIGGSPYVVGTLSAGPDIDEDNSAVVCRTSNLVASYGRFTVAFPALSGFLAATGENTGASRSTTLTASPNPITLPAGQTAAATTLSWTAPGPVQIRVNSPTGPAMTGIEGPSGSAQTGNWVTDGTTFYLQDAGDGDSSGAAKTLTTVRVQVVSSGSIGQRTGRITATPNPIPVSAGQRSGSSTISWQATGVTRVQIRVGSASGAPLTGPEAPSGTATTGTWVTHGTRFYLQDASSGSSSGAARTLALVTVLLAPR
jgi:hypothetical protein